MKNLRLMQLFELEVKEEAFYDEVVHLMYMPPSWRNYLKDQTYSEQSSARQGKSSNDYKLAFKVKPLGKKLQSIFPEIINVALDYKFVETDLPWIVATEKISESLIKRLTLGWLASAKKCTVSELPEDLKKVELSWITTRFGEIPTDPTQKIIDKYQWLPAFAALKFCAEPRKVELGQGIIKEFQFYHTIFNGKHECVTEPYMKSSKHDPFSYALRVSLQNRGGDADRMLLSVSVGRRRYVKDSKIKMDKKAKELVCYLKDNHACSVLVSVQNPELDQHTKSFSQLQFERFWDKNKETFTRWKDALDNLYWDILYGGSFEADMLLTQPIAYLEGKGGITAWVVNHNSFRNAGNWVKAGLGISEKRGLFNAFKEVLAAYDIKPLQPIVGMPRNKMNNKRLPIVCHKAQDIIIEVYSSKEMFAAMKQAYTTPLKFIDTVSKKEAGVVIFKRQISDSMYELNSNKEVTVEFIHRDPEGIVHELEIGTYTADIAYTKLVEQMKRKLAIYSTHRDKKTLALIELNGKDSWREGADPKTAIRDAMKQSGRLSQFIEPLTNQRDVSDEIVVEGDEDTGSNTDTGRMVNALLDLLNDAGFLSHNVTKLEEDKLILSFHVLKADKDYLPVVSKMDGTEVVIKMLGADTWIPLGDAPFHLHRAKMLKQPNKYKNNSSAVFKAFVTQVIENELDRDDRPIVVMMNAQLRKGWLDVLQNPRIQYDVVPYLNERLANESRIKFIRINTTQDVPQYRIFDPANEDTPKKESGIFKDPLGIYYGVGGRPSAWKGSLVTDIKFTSPSKLLLQQRAVECIPLGPLDENERDELANLVDQLRRVGLTFDTHTVDPYPIKVLHILSKYLTGNEEFFDDGFDEEVEVVEESDEIPVM
ncbi:hypothetical protein ABD76_27445 [Paenibacillus dendritiformis]|uniref:pPIWI_RE module domain-containing protein n=1 Tax=Paenibacillus dendritiformis TaxID=130049 RepID=UPI0018CEA8E6|nr:DUF3962 domain-containing protein [Paenibacillus dendritiformis]MBG9795968.1 hypothetical protein [Paenibacillus dendritiformis]